MRAKLYPDGDRVGPVRTEWQYDAAERLASIPTLISTMTYDARGRVLTANYVNGVVQANVYDGVRLWLDRIIANSSAPALATLSCEGNYDN